MMFTCSECGGHVEITVQKSFKCTACGREKCINLKESAEFKIIDLNETTKQYDTVLYS